MSRLIRPFGLFLLLGLVAGCMDTPTEQEFGFIQVRNETQVPVAAWLYSYCGSGEVVQVEFASESRTLPPGQVATKGELAGSCTDHTFRFADERVERRESLRTEANQTVEIVLRAPDA
jgi:hypothetical protein